MKHGVGTMELKEQASPSAPCPDQPLTGVGGQGYVYEGNWERDMSLPKRGKVLR